MLNKHEVFVQQYKEIVDVARKALPDVAKAQLSDREWKRMDLSDMKVTDISEDYVTFEGEYNDACGCHPEMQTAHVYVNWDTIENAASLWEHKT